MRTRNNKLFNFILEFSQIMLVFLGVYSAFMCTAYGLDLNFDRGICALIMLPASILFYGLFSVLETFRRGKLYGLLGITAFTGILLFRFFGAVKKGAFHIGNAFLKQFMSYTGSNRDLLVYKDTESASITFCTTFLLVLTAVYFIALISAFFYRKRRSSVFIALTLPFVLLPFFVGRMGYFSNILMYLVVLMSVVGSRHLRTDATDRRLRQKISVLLLLVGLGIGGISWFVMPPERFEAKEERLLQVKNSVTALAGWSMEDIFTWIRSNFNGDAIDYGRIGKKSEVVYSGKTLVRISGKVNSDQGMYLKAYVGDIYEKNRWHSLFQDSEYEADLKKLQDRAVTLDNWHVQLRNELGDSETSGVSGIWTQGTLRIRNLAFGYGNYLVPYLPSDSFRYRESGRITVDNPGIDYEVPYYPIYSAYQRKDILDGSVSLANHVFWEENAAERQELTDFAKKYYLQIPESIESLCTEFQARLKKAGIKKADGTTKGNEARILNVVKETVTDGIEYTLAPGKTPSGKDSVEYFLKENKKGYCTYYATAAVILLRSAGIPARYVEGMYIPAEMLKECGNGKEISVPDRNAHAWVEVYNEKYGFVPLEVTPGIGESDSSQKTSDSPQENDKEPEVTPDVPPEDTTQENTIEEPEHVTPEPIVSEVPQEDMIFDDIQRNSSEETAPSEGGNSHILRNVLWAIAIVFAFLFAVEVQRRIRRYIFERNLRHMRMKRRIEIIHRHLSILLRHKGVLYHRQTMAEYTKEISLAMEMPYDKIYDYVTLVYRASFGPDDITEEDMAVFRITYENIRRKTYENAGLLKKIYYMYIMVL